MTTTWQVPKLWPGASVAILGNSPAMSAELADSVRDYPRIAVNRAVRFAPSADMFVALDPEHHRGLEFAGLRVCGIDCEDVDALYPGLMYETVILGPSHVVELRNNVLAAMRIAARAGAAKILLLGIDADRYDSLHAATGFVGFAAGLEQVSNALREQGIEVVQISAPPAPVAAVEEELA